MIEIRNLTKKFGDFTAVDQLDLTIETGEFFGLLGPNGAGKTTTISMLSTVLLPTSGEIRIDGMKLDRRASAVKRKLSVITQEYSMRQDMTMDEVMEYQGRLYYMKKKEAWYDRTILFDAGTLPAEALKIDVPDYDKIEKAMTAYEKEPAEGGTESGSDAGANGTGTTTNAGAKALSSFDPVPVNLEDGEYSIQVNMSGGSGRANVTTPTWLIVKDGKAWAKLLWSSTYYDYMIVGGKKYLNETTDGGNSTFTIPIAVMDEDMPVIADTTAMGDPVEIEYELTFYEDSIGSKRQIPQEAAVDVLVVALVIILLGGVLNIVLKRRRKQ